MTGASHRLEGLEPDNLLAFLALLGLLRTLEATDRALPIAQQLRPRAAWDVDSPPLRPRLFLARAVASEELAEIAAAGLESLAALYEFEGRKNLDYSREECRALLRREVPSARLGARDRVDLLACLMSDGAIKDDKDQVVDPTPLCLLFGQGHQHFLERLASVPKEMAPPRRGKGKKAVDVTAAQCLYEALYEPWHRSDPTPGFRWDPEEDVRYALMAGDPTDPAFKVGTQHGANRLAAVGLGVLTLVPPRAQRLRPSIIGGTWDAGGFSFAWPIWRQPARLSAIQSILAHPDLRTPAGLAHLGVDHVVVAQRISVGKFMNFARARLLVER